MKNRKTKLYMTIYLCLIQGRMCSKSFIIYLEPTSSDPMPIICADFLQKFGLLVNLKQHRFIDSLTKFTLPGIFADWTDHCSVKVVSGKSPYHKILAEYPELTKCPPKTMQIKQRRISQKYTIVLRKNFNSWWNKVFVSH